MKKQFSKSLLVGAIAGTMALGATQASASWFNNGWNNNGCNTNLQ
jgi:hypothetical protein